MDQGSTGERAVATMRLILDIVAAGALMVVWLVTLFYWPELPPRIATHFDFQGRANGFGPRGIIFLVPGLATLLYSLMTFLPVRRETINLPYEVRDENWPRQVEIVRRMVLWLRAEMLAMIAYIGWGLIRAALGEPVMSPLFVLVAVGSALVTAGIFLYRSWLAR